MHRSSALLVNWTRRVVAVRPVPFTRSLASKKEDPAVPKQPQQSEGMKAPPVVEETITEESEYDKDIQPEWLAMERRVKGHKSKPKSEGVEDGRSKLLPSAWDGENV